MSAIPAFAAWAGSQALRPLLCQSGAELHRGSMSAAAAVRPAAQLEVALARSTSHAGSESVKPPRRVAARCHPGASRARRRARRWACGLPQADWRPLPGLSCCRLSCGTSDGRGPAVQSPQQDGARALCLAVLTASQSFRTSSPNWHVSRRAMSYKVRLSAARVVCPRPGQRVPCRGL